MHWITEARLYAIWAAVGPLIGVIVGAWLSARWQRRRWLLDKKALEYRQILDSLNAFRWRIVNFRSKLAANLFAMDARAYNEEVEALGKAQVELDTVRANRIFTRASIAKSGIREELAKLDQLQESSNLPSLTETYNALEDLHLRITEAAVADLNLGRSFGWPKVPFLHY